MEQEAERKKRGKRGAQRHRYSKEEKEFLNPATRQGQSYRDLSMHAEGEDSRQGQARE